MSAAEPWLSRGTCERETQQGPSCGGEVPLTPNLYHPAAQEVLKPHVHLWKKPQGNLVKIAVKAQSDMLAHTLEGWQFKCW